jgi:hypothetical protein
MELLQREIPDERKVKLKPLESGNVGSMGMMFLGAGIAPHRMSYSTVPRLGDLPVTYSVDEIFAHMSITQNIRSSRNTRGEASNTIPLRDRELAWRRSHRDALKSFENEWVVLERESKLLLMEAILYGS